MADHTIIQPGIQPSLRPGPRKQVGKYRIQGILGEGAMGVVYAGHDPDIDRDVAIKTVHRHLIEAAGSEEWLERFAREARTAGRVLHPNLVTVFDFLQDDGVPYLVMEKVRSVTLEDRLRAPQTLSLAEVHAILSQILAGLACIHKAGIVHRDMKPANVMLAEDGGVKLTDFGIARITAMDRTGAAMVGTPSYMAPEQFSGGEVDARADIYACGVLLYELLTGRKPFQGGGIEALFNAVRSGSVVAPSQIVPGLSAAHDAVVLKAISVDPADRFADAATMRIALASALPSAAEGSGVDLTRVARPAREDGSATSNTMLQHLSSDTLLQIETHLIGKMGPMGRIIARRAAASTRTAEEMIGAVLEDLVADDRADVRDSILRLLSANAGPPAAGLPAQTLQRLAELLKPHLGPIATLLVKRQAAKAATQAELVAGLAGQIEDDAERRHFHRAVAAELGDPAP